MRRFGLAAAALLMLSATGSWAQTAARDVFRREKLGPQINTDEYDESAPLLSSDGRMLFFWSLNRPDSYGLQDIYVSVQDSQGHFLPASNAGAPLNDQTCNMPFAVTPDGTQLLVYAPNARTGSDVAVSRREPLQWGRPTPLKIDGYANAGQASMSAYLGADGVTLLLSIIGPDSHGQEDLYVSFYSKQTRSFSTPRNLGAVLNTPGSEITPFLAPDGITLYFSSNGLPGGQGGDDIWMTRRLDDTWQHWSKPVNLGPRINTPGDEYYFRFAADAKYGYFVSNYQSPSKDIYRALLPASILPKPVMLVTGRVLDQRTQATLPASIRYEDLATGEELGIANTDTLTNTYSIILPAGKTYGFMAEAYGYMAISENLEVKMPAGKTYGRLTRDLTLARLEAGQTVRLNNLFFPTASAVLAPNSRPELLRLAELMKRYPTMIIEILGHTDAIGNADANLKLSEARARAVADFLIEQGVVASRVGVNGLGATKPVAENATEAGRARNRRVEVRIIMI